MRPSSGPLNQSPASPQPLSPLQLRAGPASSPDLARRGRRAYPSGGRRPAGFTLVEMLVVISIIAILAGMLMPAIMAARVKAQETHTLNLIHNCEIAATDFFNDYGDYPPSTWAELDEFFEVEGVKKDEGCFTSTDSYGPAPDSEQDTWVDEFPMQFDRNMNDYDDTEPDKEEAPRLCRINEGIEVFLACVASQNGGPYMEVEASWVANTDADFDRSSNDFDEAGDVDTDPDILQATNWYFGG
ncbi:MAG: type II secretion system protein, partial [Candidatus Brocadiia bacterium]